MKNLPLPLPSPILSSLSRSSPPYTGVTLQRCSLCTSQCHMHSLLPNVYEKISNVKSCRNCTVTTHII